MTEQRIVCSCGADVNPGARFCRHCGVPVPEQITSLAAALTEGALDVMGEDEARRSSPPTPPEQRGPIEFELSPPVGRPVDIGSLGTQQVLAPPDSSTVLIPATPAGPTDPRLTDAGSGASLPAPPTASELEARRSLVEPLPLAATPTDTAATEWVVAQRPPRTPLTERLREVLAAARVGLRRPRTWIAAGAIALMGVGGTFGYRWISDPRRSELYEEISTKAAELRAEHELLQAELASATSEEATATDLRDRVVAARDARDALLDEIAELTRGAQNAKDATVRLEATLERYKRGDFD